MTGYRPPDRDPPPLCDTCGARKTWECTNLPQSRRGGAFSGEGQYSWVCLPCRRNDYRQAPQPKTSPRQDRTLPVAEGTPQRYRLSRIQAILLMVALYGVLGIILWLALSRFPH